MSRIQMCIGAFCVKEKNRYKVDFAHGRGNYLVRRKQVYVYLKNIKTKNIQEFKKLVGSLSILTDAKLERRD